MKKSAAFELGSDYGYLKDVTPQPQFFKKMAAKLKLDPGLLAAVFNKKAMEKTAGWPLALLAGGLVAAPEALRFGRRLLSSPYDQRFGPYGRGLPNMSNIGGLDPRAMSDVMGYGAQMRALGAQSRMIDRMFRPGPMY